MLLTCFCVCSRQTGAINRVIDRGSRAINYILTVMVFNVVPIILEVLTDCCVWMLWSISCACCQWCYFLRQIFFSRTRWRAAHHLLRRNIWLFFGFCWYSSFADWYGVRHTCLQVWFNFCLDYFSFSCYLYCFHFGYHTGANTILCHQTYISQDILVVSAI
jgi:hypothetical protein